MISGERRDKNPIIRRADGTILRPDRIPFAEKQFDEGWLQDLIESTPDVLPVSEIESSFAPLISIGREVSTRAGYIDNLFLSPQGYLTLVETKLWRNPQARREVVGQIIDYAKELTTWSYEDLEAKVKNYNRDFRGNDYGILQTINTVETVPAAEEAGIIDTISHNLQRGRLLLLIAGDGIRESVEEMFEFLSQTPQLHYNLALVELQVYEMPEAEQESLLVVPHVVMRTREVVRAVVRVEAKEIGQIDVSLDQKTVTPRVGTTLTEEDFFLALKRSIGQEDLDFTQQMFEDMENRGCIVESGVGSLKVKLADPSGSGKKLSLLFVDREGIVYLGYLLGQLRDLGLPEKIAFDLVRNSGEIVGKDLPQPKGGLWWTQLGMLSDLRSHYKAFAAVVQGTIDEIRKASKG